MSWFADVEDSASMQWRNIIRSGCWLSCGQTLGQGFLLHVGRSDGWRHKSAESDTKTKVYWKRRCLVQIWWNSREARIGRDSCCLAKNWQILRYYHEIEKKSPVSRCHLQLTSATIKSTERPANQPTIEEEAFSPLASNSERGVCVCATAIFVMVASFTKCPCYSCYVENLISLKYSTVVMHCRWIDTLFL